MNVKGLKIQDIINMDWEQLNRLSEKDLKMLTSRLVSASNKRIRRLEKTGGESSFAYQKVEERGRLFSVKGKNLQQTKQEFKLASTFLKYKTSTVKGWNKYKKQMEKRVSGATYGESQTWGKNTWKKFWKVYRKHEEIHGGTFKKGDSDRIQKMLFDLFDSSDKRKSVDYFQDILEDKYTEMYESNDDIDDFFETDEFDLE